MATDYRESLHTLMVDTIADEKYHGNWVYRAVRPMHVPYRPWAPKRVVHGDCGKGCQYLCWWAHVPEDPMGRSYDAYGNSSSLCLHLQHLDHPSQMLVGDIVTFGAGGDEHAAMVMEKGTDPLLWSFGHQGAPNSYRLSADRRVHQCLRVPMPKYIPTPDDKLRAKTGYWAWLQWRLGEGDWRHHQPSAKTVRPDVPAVIPPNWWLRYGRFLKNRKKGTKASTG